MRKIKFLLKWKIIIPVLLIIVIAISLIVVFQPLKTSSRINHILSPVKLSSFNQLEPYCESIVVIDNVAYISELGVSILNISDLLHPSMLGRFFDGGAAHQLHVRDNLIYFADAHDGLEILDISNYTDIHKIGNTVRADDAYGLDIVDDLAYLSVINNGLYVFNISNPASPSLCSSYSSSKSYTYLKVHGNYAFVTCVEGLEILDISNLNTISSIGVVGSMGYIRHFQVVGNLLYAANRDTGLEIYDISNVNNPKLLGCFHDGGKPCYVHVVEDYAYVADYDDGLEIIDVSNPKKMVEIGEFHEVGDYIRTVQVVDNLAYIIDASGDGLEIIQLW